MGWVLAGRVWWAEGFKLVALQSRCSLVTKRSSRVDCPPPCPPPTRAGNTPLLYGALAGDDDEPSQRIPLHYSLRRAGFPLQASLHVGPSRSLPRGRSSHAPRCSRPPRQQRRCATSHCAPGTQLRERKQSRVSRSRMGELFTRSQDPRGPTLFTPTSQEGTAPAPRSPTWFSAPILKSS